MSNNIVKLNRLSDNHIELNITTKDGLVINPKYKWLRIYLKTGSKILKVVNDPSGIETKYSHIEGDKLIIDIPSKKLNEGIIEYMIETRNNDENFNDKFQNIFSLDYVQTNIELV